MHRFSCGIHPHAHIQSHAHTHILVRTHIHVCLGTVINGANVTPEVATHRSRHRFGFGSCWLGLSWGTLLFPSSSSVGCCGCFAFTVSLVCNAPFSSATAFFRIFPSFCASCVWFCHPCNRWQIRTKRVWLFLLYVRGVSVCVWRVIVVDFYLVFHKAVEMVLQLAGLPLCLCHSISVSFCLSLCRFTVITLRMTIFMTIVIKYELTA